MTKSLRTALLAAAFIAGGTLAQAQSVGGGAGAAGSAGARTKSMGATTSGSASTGVHASAPKLRKKEHVRARAEVTFKSNGLMQ